MNKMTGCLYNVGLNCMLKGMNLFYRLGGIIDSFFAHLLGLDDYWYFFDGHIYPVHSKYVNGYSKKDATWLYNKRTNVWRPIRGCGKTYFYMPWISSSVFALTDKEENEGLDINCTDFITNQKIYRVTDEKRIFPGVDHLFGAWAIQHKAIFTLHEVENASFDVFTLDAEELSIPILSLKPNDLYKQSLCGNEDSLEESGDSEEESSEESREESGDSEEESGEDSEESVSVSDVSDKVEEVEETMTVTNEYIIDKATGELIKKPVFDMGIIRARQDTYFERMDENIVADDKEEKEKEKEKSE